MKSTKFLVLSIILFAFGCKYFRGDQCNNTKPLVGVYKNVFDKKAKNFLMIYDDGRFDQLYIKDSIEKTNSGTWRMSKAKDCYVIFDGLKVHHELSNMTMEFFTDKGSFKFNDIHFVEGLSYEFNYYRVD